jgi:hypothetical protein
MINWKRSLNRLSPLQQSELSNENEKTEDKTQPLQKLELSKEVEEPIKLHGLRSFKIVQDKIQELFQSSKVRVHEFL